MATSKTSLDRRNLLRGLGAMIVLSPVACGGAGEATSGGGDGEGASGAGAGGAGSGGMGSGASGGTGGMSAGAGGTGGGGPVTCALTPEQTEGPFYLNADLLRDDIVETKPGTVLELTLYVVQMPDCTPIEGVAVDIWHADHLGQYSGFPGQGENMNVDTTGETFLRGTQITDAGGRVTFHTVYPGWYPGRAVHIHFKVHLPGNMEVTSQLYFPDAINAAAYTDPPYDQRGNADTPNTQDGILNGTADGGTLLSDVAAVAGGFAGSLTIGIL